MSSWLRYPVDEIPFVFLVMVIAFTLHEYAHAYFADKFGDPTPRAMGRVTLNPRVHIDILGALLIFIAGFGWAKPVYVRASFFKKPRLMSIIVSVAGPLANLLLVFVSMLLVYVLYAAGVQDYLSSGGLKAIAVFLQYMISLNLLLFLFNLLPLPPLDGYRILFEFFPLRVQERLRGLEQWALFIFIMMIFIPSLFNATIGQVFKLMGPILYGMNSFLQMFFGSHGQLERIFIG